MIIKWLGHSCFLITNSSGVRILTDPVDAESGYDIGRLEAEIVTVSHDHHDHNNTAAVTGQPVIIDGDGACVAHGVKFTGISTWHDELCGQKRGINIMFMIETDGIRLLHAGDIGHLPDPSTINMLGHTDVLFVPTGGVYTIGYEKALAFIDILKPKLIVPMHFRTPCVTFKLGELSPFLNRASEQYSIRTLHSSEFHIEQPITDNGVIIIPDHTR